MTALDTILDQYRASSQSEREKGTYFEELCLQYFKNEPYFRDLYSHVWTYGEWAKLQGIEAKDTGIDLVAKTHGTEDIHAIQCKCYAEDYKVAKKDIDSFFTASGKEPFKHRYIVATTNNWTDNAEDALQNQQIPVQKIDLTALRESLIDWSKYQPNQVIVLKPKKSLREHQKSALNATLKGFETVERGKLIMACGTGKTFTSLKIAESFAGKGKRVLFLVPSLSLLSQTLTEWTQESHTPLHSFAVCSDTDVGKKRKKDDDVVNTLAHELRYGATTEAKKLAHEFNKRQDTEHMSVIFSTYHSIQVISDAQKQFGLPDFDLIICDEAHRTTGATFGDDAESNFVKIHNPDFIKSNKRLYMTATPRIYAPAAKANAEKDNVALCSMDDPDLYGHELYVINFSEAVKRELLVDYKVIVLAVDAKHVSSRIQGLLKDDNNSLKVDDACKIVGCWKALSKIDTQDDLTDDFEPMRRAVAFCQVIERSEGAKVHKVSSKQIAEMFAKVVEAYQESEIKEGDISSTLKCEAEHVDGAMNATTKEEKLEWLKAPIPDDTCRILSNVRCLSEGVDVPALDAVLFLTPRNSQVDVVQSVGRVMRLAEGKTRGYVILPVVIPEGVEPHVALNDNKIYGVVWQVLQALRSHDDRFDAFINKVDLIGKDPSKMEVIAITGKDGKYGTKKQPKAKGASNGEAGSDSFGIGSKQPQRPATATQAELQFEIGEIEKAIYAKVVQKVGNKSHWEDWANDIAKIANTHIIRIQGILENPENTLEIAAFNAFCAELRNDINSAISDSEIIEMLAQHLITKPVFDALFSDYSFAKNNPMSQAMQAVIDILQKHNIDKEADTLGRFYDSVAERANGIDSAQGKQKIVVELYDKFFRNAFPRMTERLGIVYTPVEVVDFIIHSVNDVLKSEFGQTLGSKNVHIIDPFTGTGTFITRLMQSGLISADELPYKYQNEIHANEIVLLAYYIAAINIESVYHDLLKQHSKTTDYQPFKGICLTDTFQMYENKDLVDEVLLEENNARRKRQKSLDIRVIIGNPPYSAGQESANDDNANVSYPSLDDSIRSTYAAQSQATNKNALYDSYIRAIRWASNQIAETGAGVIGFVTNAGFVEANTADGLRKCLVEEFSSLYIFHLRGNARTSGEQRRKEKDNVFGQGTRTPVAISLLVKNPKVKKNGQIYFHDIGDYLSQTEKLDKIIGFASIDGISQAKGWQLIQPDQHGDWINQRDDSFSEHISLGDKKDKNSVTVFTNYSQGLMTSRDAWCFQFSKTKLIKNMHSMIDFYNENMNTYEQSDKLISIESLVDGNSARISWSSSLLEDAKKLKIGNFKETSVLKSIYRPFQKQWLYCDDMFNHRQSQMLKIFPTPKQTNRTICVLGKGESKAFSVLISDSITEYKTLYNNQCFPLKLYEKIEVKEVSAHDDLFADSGNSEHHLDMVGVAGEPQYEVKDGITDAGLKHFADYYPTEEIGKEDLFYYIYGLLHSEDYKARYADNLTKELPRIPRVKQAANFWHFSQAGRALAKLHINYETVDKYPVTFDGGNLAVEGLADADFYVTGMKFGKGSNGEKHDKTRVIYNHKITMTDIPLEAYEYVVNGKPALEWVMERQGVSTHKDSGIVNDANDWAIETMGNARYPLELFQRVITVSVETMKIVNGLPRLEI